MSRRGRRRRARSSRPSRSTHAVAAGARFLVSPGASPTLAEAAAQSPVPFLPGCATASEAMALRDARLSRAQTVSGRSGRRREAARLARRRRCRTCASARPAGSISPRRRTISSCPTSLCVGGSWMLPKDALAAGRLCDGREAGAGGGGAEAGVALAGARPRTAGPRTGPHPTCRLLRRLGFRRVFGALLLDLALERQRRRRRAQLRGPWRGSRRGRRDVRPSAARPRVTRSRTARSSDSDISVTWTRFGKKRVRVLRLEWLTLLPDWTALPVSSQRRDIALKSFNEIELTRAGQTKGRAASVRKRPAGRSGPGLLGRGSIGERVLRVKLCDRPKLLARRARYDRRRLLTDLADPADPLDAVARLEALRAAIALRARDCGRAPDEVKLVAVSKTYLRRRRLADDRGRRADRVRREPGAGGDAEMARPARPRAPSSARRSSCT